MMCLRMTIYFIHENKDIMLNGTASFEELSYIVGQHTQTLLRLDVQVSALTKYVRTQENTLKRRAAYLKTLLIYRARKRFPLKVNNYIITLCDSVDAHVATLPPFLEDDMTPAWVIADMIFMETDERLRESLMDIFKYVYEVLPESFFVA